MKSDTAAAFSLLTADAVRSRAHRLLALGLEGRLPHFQIEIKKLGAVADRVIAVTRAAYPALDVPFHSRWRHFVHKGVDRFAALAAKATWKDPAARARAEFDLAIVSVFLDAGAGAQWRYTDPKTGERIGRSEGLALASLDMFAAGAFSADERDPLRVDATKFAQLSPDDLARGFQVTADNPLVGLDGRAALLRRLGDLLAWKPDVFAKQDAARPGGLFDYLVDAHGKAIAAPDILAALLRELGPIWPSRLSLGGVALGDCWKHRSLVTDDATSGLVPLHKLSQWLSYSLIEPLQRAGFTVSDIDGLTGLAEYRNGGLFVDASVLNLHDPLQILQAHDVASELVVEWRSLTVALLDRLADVIRGRFGMNAETLPLARILEGGTWAAGRAIAMEKREGGTPPITVVSDGTVF
ncbi:uracil phosphoribosyltransferase [Pseudolabrys sp. Root1462]|uniref:URC4/urg3 family protein n=1 Tax=Pseudolabrys sp. Root1462 TaxID=1736466 RepID=UPI00070340C8|nr:URC4/urg3 family protein [Pseudolabrys sp. Root1462]KQZ01622.1 uracil phosphoribosyltransferase [Pseudolabrys sp. Root1462]